MDDESVATVFRTQDYNPQKLIVLSELSTKEKENYYRLLLLNQAKFYRLPDGRYVSNLRLLAPKVKRDNTLSLESDEKKKKLKDKSNYAIVFQERLSRLRTEGFIDVNLCGVEVFDYNAYPRFVSLIANKGEKVTPKLRPLSWVMKYVEDLYDSRFNHEKHDVEREEEEMPSFDIILLIFPVFVVRKLGTNVGLKSLVDQTCWDLLYSLHIYRQDYLELETFGRFLQEFYDHDDLLFFLYVRSVIAKVLHIPSFKSRWTKHSEITSNSLHSYAMASGISPAGLSAQHQQQHKSLWMTYREASHVARIVFGGLNSNSIDDRNSKMNSSELNFSSATSPTAANNAMYRDFMNLITPQMLGEKTDQHDTRRIDITEFLHLAVVGYHQGSSGKSTGGNLTSTVGSNIQNGNINDRVLLPLPGQVVPPSPVPCPPSLQHLQFSTNSVNGISNSSTASLPPPSSNLPPSYPYQNSNLQDLSQQGEFSHLQQQPQYEDYQLEDENIYTNNYNNENTDLYQFNNAPLNQYYESKFLRSLFSSIFFSIFLLNFISYFNSYFR